MEQTNFSSDGATRASEPMQGQLDSATEMAHGAVDRARDMADTAQEKLVDAGSTVRDRAGHLKGSLADVLDRGADKLRARVSGDGAGNQLAGATGTSTSVAIENDGRMTQVTGKVAGGMEATASWLRDTDLNDVKTTVERQVKEHPGRTLLIAAGIGYLFGKALRR